MSSQKMQAYFEKLFKAFNNHDLELLAQCYTDDARWHTPDGDDVGWPQIKQHHASIFTGWPDIHVAAEEVLILDEMIVWRWHMQATHTVSLNGETPTGKTVKLSGITVVRIAGGKSVEIWSEWDRLGVFQEIGLMPELS